jgi:hypothetical protein
MPALVPCADVKSGDFDGVVVVTDSTSKLTGSLQPLAAALDKFASVGERIMLTVETFIRIGTSNTSCFGQLCVGRTKDNVDSSNLYQIGTSKTSCFGQVCVGRTKDNVDS